MQEKILIAEDDKDIIELLTLYLSGEGFTVLSAENGEAALQLLQTESISAVLVDIMMPGMNGFELIRRTREFSDVPMLVLSAKDMAADKVLGLNIGADAYITKPFNPLEVVAYVKAALRRCYKMKSGAPESGAKKVELGELELDLEKFVLRKNGVPLPLTSTELKIVAELMNAPERIFTKAQLYRCINGDLYESDDNTMMVHISNLRAKIEDDPANPRYIKTVRGLGYKIENKPSASK